jgi:hypothetical protein
MHLERQECCFAQRTRERREGQKKRRPFMREDGYLHLGGVIQLRGGTPLGRHPDGAFSECGEPERWSLCCREH